jgi:hypothetical protein
MSTWRMVGRISEIRGQKSEGWVTGVALEQGEVLIGYTL